MQSDTLLVRHVRGRYPHRGVLRSANIEASVTEIARVYRIRLDDAANPDAWLELTVEVSSDALACAELAPSPACSG